MVEMPPHMGVHGNLSFGQASIKRELEAFQKANFQEVRDPNHRAMGAR